MDPSKPTRGRSGSGTAIGRGPRRYSATTSGGVDLSTVTGPTSAPMTQSLSAGTTGPSYVFCEEPDPKDRPAPSYTLLVRQHPERARICSFKDKIDRRPIDPPPIVQLVSPDGREAESHANGNLFIMVKLVDPKTGDEIRADTGAKCTAGTTIQSPHRLRDLDGRLTVFFAFPDLSIRIEGNHQLEFCLHGISPTTGLTTQLTSVRSNTFSVLPPKLFPGMASSTLLTRHIAEQGFKLRVRKKNRAVVTRVKRTVSDQSASPKSGASDGNVGTSASGSKGSKTASSRTSRRPSKARREGSPDPIGLADDELETDEMRAGVASTSRHRTHHMPPTIPGPVPSGVVGFAGPVPGPSSGPVPGPSSGPPPRSSRRTSHASASRRSTRHRSLPTPFEGQEALPTYQMQPVGFTAGLAPSPAQPPQRLSPGPSLVARHAGPPGAPVMPPQNQQWGVMLPPTMPASLSMPVPGFSSRAPPLSTLPSRPMSNPMATQGLPPLPTLAIPSPRSLGAALLSPRDIGDRSRSPPTSVALSTTASESSNAPSSAALSTVSTNLTTPASADIEGRDTPPLSLAGARLTDSGYGEGRFGGGRLLGPAIIPPRSQPVMPSTPAAEVPIVRLPPLLGLAPRDTPEEQVPPRRDPTDILDVWDRKAF